MKRMTVECICTVMAVLAQPCAMVRITAMYVAMSSPRPPWARGTDAARKPSQARSRQLSMGFAPAASYRAARGAIFSRVMRATRSTTACWAGSSPAMLAHGALGGVGLRPLRADAAARAGLVQLDHVAERIVHEDL